MYQLHLPDPGPAGDLPFRDAGGARAWLGIQPQAQPVQMQAALYKAVAAIDASNLPPAQRADLLDILRPAVILAQSALENRYTRKPLPLQAAEAEAFAACRKLWHGLAVAYLRTVPGLPPAEALRPLHRAAMALRLEQYAHFLAAYEVPPDLHRLLYGTLLAAQALGVDQTPLADREYKHLGESHVAGHVAWAFLLLFADPRRLSGAQLTVANRAFSRWRELAQFQPKPEDDPRARALPLAAVLDPALTAAGGLAWLDVRPVARKIRKRLEALEAGETPEALHLGRELSPSACVRLLRRLDDTLRPAVPGKSKEPVDVSLVFGLDNIYALLTGRFLNPAAAEPPGRAVNHQRLAVFGFDNLVTPAGEGSRVKVERESWQAAGTALSRGLAAGGRLLSPCLAACDLGQDKDIKLGVLAGLHVSLEGKLRGEVQWYPGTVRAASSRLASPGGKAASVAVLLLDIRGGLSLVLPAGAPVQPDSRLTLEGADSSAVILGQLLERGSDFVRYAVVQ